MAKYQGKDYTYLIWKDPVSRRQYQIGILSKNGSYEFKYGFEIREAIEKGFKLLVAFDDIAMIYKNDIFFPAFASRIPDRRRKDIKSILNKYGLTNYDEYELLKKSGGKLPIDDLLFIDPIIVSDDDNDETIEREFFIAGPRHYLGCEGKNCNYGLKIEKDDELFLEFEPENENDKNAIKVIDKDNSKIGYIPRYYNKELTELIKKGFKCSMKVTEYNKDKNCNECLKVRISIYK